MTSETEVVVIGAGQSGLTAARSLLARGVSPVVLEAGPEPAGSWPQYYDSLTLFSPAAYSSMPGLDFPGHPNHYPHRDEVVGYLRRYAASLDADIRTNSLVAAHSGLVYLGLEFQRSFSSNTLRGVHRDAEYVIPPLVAHVRNARATIGL